MSTEGGGGENVATRQNSLKMLDILIDIELIRSGQIIYEVVAIGHNKSWTTSGCHRYLAELAAVKGLTIKKKQLHNVNKKNFKFYEQFLQNLSSKDFHIIDSGKIIITIIIDQQPPIFWFLDCYGSSVQYLDAAFRNIPKNGILAITSTDDAALYGKAADVTLRNYGGHIIKTFYAKELAARLVLSSVARSAAKCNKGIEVLCCVAVKSFITVIVRIIRGPSAANQCIRQIRRVIHCCMCEDRAFYPHSVYPLEQPYSLLSCDCRARSPGKLAVDLGPVWCDEIFNPQFCTAMLSHSQSFTKLHKVTQLLQTIVSEAQCSSTHSVISGGDKENTLRQEKEKESVEKMEDIQHSIELEENDDEEENRMFKKIKTDQEGLRSPAFYFNLHRHCPKGYDLGKMSKIVEYLQNNGYKASRTHFDPEAIRTNARLSQLNTILLDFFAKSTQN
ncbi:unnamed protein product, partial [Meganyctiphanes norvegica]